MYLNHSLLPIYTDPKDVNLTKVEEVKKDDECYHFVKGYGQCYADKTQYTGDQKDNPIWLADESMMTLQQCKDRCISAKDAHGRPCVAIEMRYTGNQNVFVIRWDTLAPCSLAWACDHVETYKFRNFVYTRYNH